jgi:cytochrome c556
MNRSFALAAVIATHVVVGTAFGDPAAVQPAPTGENSNVQAPAPPSESPRGDDRQLVPMPPQMVQHMLAMMRDHLAAIAEAQGLAAQEKWDQAADVLESRVGMSSMERHGAARMARVMPPAMRTLGTEMHKAASRAARALAEADPQEAFAGFGEVMARCHACHAAFRVR